MDRRDMTTMAARMLACGFVSTAIGPVRATAQMQQSAPVRGRKPVIPKQVIDEFHLTPAEGYGLWALGEDGLPYSLDDVLMVLFTITREHWGGDTTQQPPSQMKKMTSKPRY